MTGIYNILQTDVRLISILLEFGNESKNISHFYILHSFSIQKKFNLNPSLGYCVLENRTNLFKDYLI